MSTEKPIERKIRRKKKPRLSTAVSRGESVLPSRLARVAEEGLKRRGGANPDDVAVLEGSDQDQGNPYQTFLDRSRESSKRGYRGGGI